MLDLLGLLGLLGYFRVGVGGLPRQGQARYTRPRHRKVELSPCSVRSTLDVFCCYCCSPLLSILIVLINPRCPCSFLFPLVFPPPPTAARSPYLFCFRPSSPPPLHSFTLPTFQLHPAQPHALPHPSPPAADGPRSSSRRLLGSSFRPRILPSSRPLIAAVQTREDPRHETGSTCTSTRTPSHFIHHKHASLLASESSRRPSRAGSSTSSKL